MRVGFNARYLREYSLRGFNRYMFCLLKALQRRPDVDLYLFTDQRSLIHPRFSSTLKASIVTLTSPRVLLWEHALLPLHLRRRGIDVFHAPADGGLPAVKACKYVLTYHDAADRGLAELIRRGYLTGRLSDFLDDVEVDSWRGRYRHIYRESLRWLYLRSADLVITVSDFARTELITLLGVRPEKIRVTRLAPDEAFRSPIPPPVIEAVKSKYGLPASYILFVGGFDKRKNVGGLLRAFAVLKGRGIEESLVVVGSGGDLEAAKSTAASLGLTLGRDVVFLASLDDDLPAIYRGATVFTTLAWKETFCFPVVEAMAAGVPVVAANSGAIPEIMGQGGVLVDPRNIEEVVGALDRVIRSDTVRRELSERSVARARVFSWDKVADETLLIYQELLRS